jgi:hypothetical protein
MEKDIRQRASRKVTISLTQEEWEMFYSYALVKGYGTAQGIASFARSAMVDKIARNAPTAEQKRRIDELIGNSQEGRFAPLHNTLEGN